jgi:hypothetical protein
VAAKVSFGDPADTADLRVALGHGDGTFGPVQVSPLAPNLGVFTLQTADLDGDGKLDVVGLSGRYDDATSSYQSSVTVVRGNGDGTFQAPAVLPVAAGPQGLAIGDLDGDGRPELVLLAADGTGKVQAVVWHNTGAPGTVAFTPAAAPALDGPNGYGSDLALADVDGDGKLDLLATYTTYGTSATTSALAVALGHGDGTFGAPDTQGVNSYGPFLRLLPGTAGHPDLAVGSGEGAVTVWHNDGAGHFTPGAPVFTDGWNWQVADLNGDGKADLVVSAWGGTGVTHHLLFGV